MAATEDPRQRLQRDLEDAYRRGQMDQVVRTLENNIFEIRAALKEIQESMSTLSKSSVAREEFETLEVTVESLKKWQWSIAGALSGMFALSQIIPRLLDLVKKAP